jgi:type II secretion system protein D
MLAAAVILFTSPLTAQPLPSPEAPATAEESNPATRQPSPAPEEMVSIQFPHTSVAEVLTVYEKLTGKRIIRDSNLAGPELSIMVSDPLPQSEAVSMLESSLLLNGYTLVPVDEKTVKILGPSRPPRSEGLPLYQEESQLPREGDKLVSFYQTLRYLSPAEAVGIIQGVIQLNAYGSLVAVPNTSAIVITDKTPVIRKALALLDVVDREPSQIITEFVPLQRAAAEKVVETLNQMFGGGSSTGGQPPQGAQGAVVATGGEAHLLSGKAQFIADKRTNRILIVVKAENYKYLRDLINKLDQAVTSDQPLVRPLNYLSVTDLFPVLVDMLRGKDDTERTSAAVGGSQAQPTPQSQNQGGMGGTGGTGGSSSAVANTPDRLAEVARQSAPQSATIGSTSIIADASANSVIVYGPPESKAKAKQIIDLLDQRPKQVYLAAVIGQLRLEEGMDYGANWFAKINTSGTNNLIAGAVTAPFAGALTNFITSGITNAISAFPSSLTGLTVFGTIAQGINTYAHFLETTGRFRVLSRPVVYTSNNKKASIFSGENIPVPVSSLTSVTPGTAPGASSIQANIQYQPVVLKLEVIPLINSDKEVNLVIAQRNDKVGTKVNVGGNEVPNILTQELTTTVRVPNGSTIVLGGLITDDKTTDDAGVPYINRIPVLGPLLGGRSNKTRKRSELVVMIQPIVVDTNESMERASIQEGSETELGMKARDLKQKLKPTPTPSPKKKKFQLFQTPKIDNY